MARALIVGCGCRGRELGGELSARDWLVRGTTRSAGGLASIEQAGFEAAEADPDRPGTILELCGDVAIVVWLLGSATAGAQQLAAIHGPRLERLLEKLVDTPVRGFAYEASGEVAPDLLRGGRGIVERASETWRIPVAFLDAPRDDPAWAGHSAESLIGLLGA